MHCMLRSTLTDRGQTTIPAKVRKALNLKPQQQIRYEIREEGVLLKAERESLMDLAGVLKSDIPAARKDTERSSARSARIKKYTH